MPAIGKNGGSKGQWGQMGHLAKTHFGHNGCDVIVAFFRHHDATSGTFDLGRGGPLVFNASQITERFVNSQAAGVQLWKPAALAGNSLKQENQTETSDMQIMLLFKQQVRKA